MNKNKIFTISLIILVYIFAITVSTYVKYVEELEKISIGYRGPATQKIKTSMFLGEYGTDNLKDLFESENINDYVIFDDSLNNPQLRGVLVKGNVNLPKILDGRFFNETDFFANKKLVVIGENMTEYTYAENEKRYLSLFNDSYEVIGICGYGINSIIDNIIFYNLDSIHHADWGIYSIDGNNVAKTNLILNTISNLGEIEIIIDENQGIKRLLGYERHSHRVIYPIIILIWILFFIKSRSFFLTIQKTLQVSKFLGFSLYHTIYITLGKWVIYETIGIISSIAIYSVFFSFSDFKRIMNGFPLNITCVIFSLFICSFIAYIVYICYYWSKKGVIKC
ncbi:hypothetical protein Amet_4174 [Alkaliphilus metalliredigens QYMF]|uniref:MacB-like periplasmic core domain-containing protein n=1 Tax=Alkaliphilus metalliredigens (strain QYMF) TaxID=293826 RepID=A6TVN7_ALKMQ|nr:hypothetical protein [Alkaliphilus metalliredigens]ABR50255.1 hypothetical protein Amet_4174 [Alkaliphilus metalliredigens QYMF]